MGRDVLGDTRSEGKPRSSPPLRLYPFTVSCILTNVCTSRSRGTRVLVADGGCGGGGGGGGREGGRVRSVSLVQTFTSYETGGELPLSLIHI